MIQIRNLELKEFGRIDNDLRAIKEVEKTYKAPHLEHTGMYNLVVEKKFENSYVENIDEILHGMIQNNNRKFNYPAKQIKARRNNYLQNLFQNLIKITKTHRTQQHGISQTKMKAIVATVTSGELIW